MERTEEDKIVQSSIKVMLGGKEYEIKPLPIKYSLPWVKKVADILVDLGRLSKITSDKESEFRSALLNIMVEKPTLMVDLFFQYARDLKRSEIEEVASSSEIVVAFEGVLSLERPLFGMAIRIPGKVMPSV